MTKNDVLRFPADTFSLERIQYNGAELVYKAYLHLLYAANPVDPDYQSMNLFVPVSWGEKALDPSGAPIILQNRCGGYASSINRGEKKVPPGHSRPSRQPMPDDPRIGPARGQEGKGSVNEDDYVHAALTSGFVVAVPGNRGRDCQFPDGRYYGKAPAMIVDLKAAVRYLRHNAGLIPGDMEHIISKGASAGGGLSALLSVSGNDDAYTPYLAEIGAADGRDDVYAGICISPVLDLEHQDSGYEWQYGRIPLYGFDGRPKPPVDQALSAGLSAQYEEYLRSLCLTCRGDWGPLTPETYRDYYLKEFLLPSADRWLLAQDSETRRVYLEDRPWIHWDGAHASFTFTDYEDYLGRLKGLPPSTVLSWAGVKTASLVLRLKMPDTSPNSACATPPAT